MNWKKSIIFCASFLIAFFVEMAVNIACGPEQDPYDYYVSYFHNNVQGDGYSPFAFNEMVYLYETDEPASEPEINSLEWAKYLQVKKDDVFKVMYDADSTFESKLVNFSKKSLDSLPAALRQNSFLLGLIEKEAALKYFRFAKSCEPFTKSYYDSWDPVARDSAMMDRKSTEALTLASKEKDQFLKLRYAFQAERMQHYARNYEACKATYEKFISPLKTESAVQGWARSLYAGAMRYTGNPAEAAYLFSMVFATNPERRIQAYRNYFACRASLASVLEFTKNEREKANVFALRGFGNPSADLESLEQVYHYDPGSLTNGALLIREVNKLEQNLIKGKDVARNYYATYFSRFNVDNKKQDSIHDAYLNHLLKIKDFALRMASEKKYPQPELGTLTAAYLSWMENKDLQGLNYLAALKPNQLPERLKDQYRIIELLIKANQIKKGGSFNPNELLPALRWLDEKRFAENKLQPKDQDYYDDAWGDANRRFTTTTRNFYQQVLAPAYLKMGDTAMAAVAMFKADLKYSTINGKSIRKNMSYQTTVFWQNSLSPSAMRNLAVLKAKPANGNFESWLSKALNKINNDDFYELFGTTYLRTHQYAKAISCFDRVSKAYVYQTPSDWYSDNANQKTYAQAFIERVNDYPKQYGKVAPGLNKKTFAQEMLRIQKLIKNDQKNAAQYYYKMANAVYQTGYYGNSWFLISYDWVSYDIHKKVKFSYDLDYKLAQTAKIWYLKARALSKDANFKAKCTFMIAKCEQKKIINSNYDKIAWYQGDYDLSYKRFLALNYNNPYFKEMKLKYKNTAFYKIAATECSYFREFIGPAK
jgi:hypothetical protein